jgi:hypothetical protein
VTTSVHHGVLPLKTTPDLEIYDHRFHPTEESSVFWYAIPVMPPRGA